MFTLPNLLTYIRISLIPFVMICLFSGDSFYSEKVSTFLFLIAALSDFFDGYLARQLNQSSELGRFLDPIADKLIVIGVFVALLFTGRIYSVDLIPITLIFFREIFVSGLREYLGNFGAKVPVSYVAKWKTTAQLVCIPFLMAVPVWSPFYDAGRILLWVASLLTVYTGWDYFKIALRYMKR